MAVRTRRSQERTRRTGVNDPEPPGVGFFFFSVKDQRKFVSNRYRRFRRPWKHKNKRFVRVVTCFPRVFVLFVEQDASARPMNRRCRRSRSYATLRLIFSVRLTKCFQLDSFLSVPAVKSRNVLFFALPGRILLFHIIQSRCNLSSPREVFHSKSVRRIFLSLELFDSFIIPPRFLLIHKWVLNNTIGSYLSYFFFLSKQYF